MIICYALNIIPPMLSIVSCAPRGKEIIPKSTYQKINHQNIIISNDNFWGKVNTEVDNNIIDTLAKKCLLTNDEKKSLKINPLLKVFKTIPDHLTEERQNILVYIGSKPNQQVAEISLTWKLTKAQIPIYPIYKAWPLITKHWSPEDYNPFNLKIFDVWNNNKKRWDKTKLAEYKNLNLNGKILAPYVISYINGWSYDLQIPKKNLIIPSINMQINKTVNVKNLLVKNFGASFPLLIYAWYSKIPFPMSFGYSTNYYFVKNILPKLDGLQLLNITSNSASDPTNEKAIRSAISDAWYPGTGTQVGQSFDAFIKKLTFTGTLKAGDSSKIEVYYDGTDTNLTISISVSNN